MIIIGEKINGAIPSVAEAIAARNEEVIKKLAIAQSESGANYLDVCAGTNPESELEVLKWLLEIVQKTVDTPICIDSPDHNIIAKVLPEIDHIGLINSVSGEGRKCEVLYPLVADSQWRIIALTCDDQGIPADAERKYDIAVRLISKADEYGIKPDRLYIDPLVLSLSAINTALLSFTETVVKLKAAYPTVHITSGLSNISYGMPRRRLINQIFLAYALQSGMDSAIMDPTNKDMYATILAAENLLGRDKYSRAYNKAFRQGRI